MDEHVERRGGRRPLGKGGGRAGDRQIADLDGYVRLETAAALVGQALKQGGVASGGDEIVAATGEPQRQGAADPRGGARDERAAPPAGSVAALKRPHLVLDALGH